MNYHSPAQLNQHTVFTLHLKPNTCYLFYSLTNLHKTAESCGKALWAIETLLYFRQECLIPS